MCSLEDKTWYQIRQILTQMYPASDSVTRIFNNVYWISEYDNSKPRHRPNTTEQFSHDFSTKLRFSNMHMIDHFASWSMEETLASTSRSFSTNQMSSQDQAWHVFSRAFCVLRVYFFFLSFFLFISPRRWANARNAKLKLKQFLHVEFLLLNFFSRDIIFLPSRRWISGKAGNILV